MAGFTPEQKEELKKMLGDSNATRNFQGNSGAPIMDLIKAVVNTAETGVREVAGLAEKSMSNTADASDIVKSVSSILRTLGPGGQIAGDALNFLGNIVTDSLSNWQRFSTEGLNFAGNALAFRASVMRTGMSFEEFGESLDKIKPAMFQLGTGIAGGLEAFGKISLELNKPELQVALNTMGILPKEANEILAMTIRLGRTNNIAQDPGNLRVLAENAVKLATEMDAMAKLTGISRREQQKNIETIENDARVRARLSQLMNDPTKREGIGNVMAAGGVLPPEARKALAETIAGSGIMTSEKLSDLTLTYGSKVAQMYIKIGQLSDGTAEDQAEAARITKELIPAMVEGRRQMAQYVRFGANTSGMGMEAYDINGAASNYENTIAKLMLAKDKGGQGMTQAEAEIEAKKRAIAQAEGKLIEDMVIMVKNADGVLEQKVLKAKVNGEYNEMDPAKYATQLATTVKSVATGVGVALNEGVAKIGETLIEFQLDSKTGKYVPTAESMKLIQASEGAAEDEKNKKQAINFGTAVGQQLSSFVTTNTKAMTDLPTNMANAFEKIWSTMIGSVAKKALGSKGTTGEWFENGPQLTLIGEGGESESVVPYSQRGAFIRDNLESMGLGGANMNSILRNIPAMVSSGTKNVEQAVSEMASVMPDSNLLAEKLDKLSSIMASVERNIAESANHARETAKNTREIGGIIA